MRLTKEKRKELKKLYLESHPRDVLSTAFITKALKDFYGVFHVDEKEAAEWNLLNIYEMKLSERLKQRMVLLRADGERQANDRFKKLIYADNPFLALIRKHEKEGGFYMPIPLKFDTPKGCCISFKKEE